MSELNVYGNALEKTNDPLKLRDLYSKLALYSKKNSSEVVASLKKGLFNPANDADSLKCAYVAMRELMVNDSRIAKDMLDVLKLAVTSKKNNGSSLKEGYDLLGDMVTAKPNMAGKVIDVAKTSLKNKNNNDDSFKACYKTLESVSRARPDLTKDVLDTTRIILYKQWLHKKDTVGYVGNELLGVIGAVISGKKNDSGDLTVCYSLLNSISDKRPDLADKVLNIAETALTDKHNNADSLEDGFNFLESLLDNVGRNYTVVNTGMYKQFFDITKTMITSKHNNSKSLSKGNQLLAKIAEFYKPDENVSESAFKQKKVQGNFLINKRLKSR